MRSLQKGFRTGAETRHTVGLLRGNLASGLCKNSYLVFRVKGWRSLHYNFFGYPWLFSGVFVFNHEAWSRLCFGTSGKGSQKARWSRSLGKPKSRRLECLLCEEVTGSGPSTSAPGQEAFCWKYSTSVNTCPPQAHVKWEPLYIIPDQSNEKISLRGAGPGPEKGCSLSNRKPFGSTQSLPCHPTAPCAPLAALATHYYNCHFILGKKEPKWKLLWTTDRTWMLMGWLWRKP